MYLYINFEGILKTSILINRAFNPDLNKMMQKCCRLDPQYAYEKENK